MNASLTPVMVSTDPFLQMKIGDTSILATARLQSALTHLKTFRMLLDQIRETGPSETTDKIILHIVKEVNDSIEWVNDQCELLLDFVVDLKDIICKLLLKIQKELKFLIS
jgi:hypothetical protein